MGPHRRTVVLRLAIFLCILAAAALYYRHYRKSHFWAPLNHGDYAGPATRPASRYDPTKPPSRPWLDDKRAATPQTTYHRYAAATLDGGEADFLLYLPPGYDHPAHAARRYPVIYWLHGYAAAPQYALPFLEALDAAVRRGDCPPVIAVLPNGLYASWYADSVDGSQPVESLITRDLIPHVDATWRTIPDRRHRAVEGFSMGAWGAAHLACKRPDLFCAATLISAPMHTHRTFPQFNLVFSNDADAFYAEDPVTLAHRRADTLKTQLRFRIFIGDRDPLLPFARAFDADLAAWGYPHSLTVIPKAGHDDDAVYAAMGTGAFGFYKEVFGEAGTP